MKVLGSFEGGAIVISEQAGDFYLAVNGALGGGSVAGWLSGQASIKLGSGTVGLKAAEGLLNHLLPASTQAIALMIESAINSAVAAL